MFSETAQETKPHTAAIASEHQREERRPIPKSERRALDQALAIKLDELGKNPWSTNEHFLMDLESGNTVQLLPVREHWAFAGTAKAKAAALVKVFAAYADRFNTDNIRAFVLRPEFRKAGLGELKQFLTDVGQTYGRVIDKARDKGIARPFALFIHIRWDDDLQVWDLHLHAFVEVKPENTDKLFLRLAKKFSTPKHISDIKSIGALVNYSASWIVDHRKIASWPTEALIEFWNLDGAHLMRKGGGFAAFAATLRNKDVTWQGDKVVVAEKEPTKARQDRRRGTSPLEGLVSYAYVRFGGQRRLCAIFRYRRASGVAAHNFNADTLRRQKPTTIAGSSPPPTRTPEQATLRRTRVWSKIWCYGSETRQPRPVRRRLENAGVTVPKRQGLRQRRQGRP